MYVRISICGGIYNMQNGDVMLAKLIEKVYWDAHGIEIDPWNLQRYLYFAELESCVIAGNSILENDIEYWSDVFCTPMVPCVFDWMISDEYEKDNGEIQVSFTAYYIVKKIIREMKNCTQLCIVLKISEQEAYQKARKRAELAEIKEFYRKNDKLPIKDIKMSFRDIITSYDITEDAKEIRKKRGIIWYKEKERYLFLKEQVRKEIGEDIITIGECSRLVDKVIEKYSGKGMIRQCYRTTQSRGYIN